MIRLAAYGEEEFPIGIPGSNGEGVLVAQIKTSSRAQVNRHLSTAAIVHSRHGTSSLPGTVPGDPDALSEMPIFSSSKPKRGVATGLRLNVIEASLTAGLAFPKML